MGLTSSSLNSVGINLSKANLNKKNSPILKENSVFNFFGTNVSKEQIFNAVANGDLDEVRIAIQNNQINITNDSGSTLLHLACEKNQTKIAKMLIDAGLAVDIKDEHESTCLHFACSEGNIEIVIEILAAEFNKDFLDTKALGVFTPLHFAAIAGHHEIVLLLLIAGSQIDVKDEVGCTSLQWATIKGHLEVVKILLMAGAEVKLSNELDELQVFIQSNENYTQCVRYIENYTRELENK